MGGWIVLFFVAAMALMVNTLQTETSERRASHEIESAVDTLVNIVHGQHRYYLYANPTSAAGFITSNLSGELEWLDDRDCGGRSCYSVVGSASNVKVLYRARSPAIAARVALHFGDMACVGNSGGVCDSTANPRGEHVILNLVPVEDLPLMAHFASRSEPVIEDGNLLMSPLPTYIGYAAHALHVKDRGMAIARGLSFGLTANNPSFGPAYQDHTEPLWGEAANPIYYPGLYFGGDYVYQGNGVLIEAKPQGGDLVRYTRAQAGRPVVTMQARAGNQAILSFGDVNNSDNHVIRDETEPGCTPGSTDDCVRYGLYVDEVESASETDLSVWIGELEGVP